MNEKQIKRFFETYKYPVTVVMNDDRVIDVMNHHFHISEGVDGRLWMSYTETNGELIEYDFNYDIDSLYSMIIAGWSITHDFASMIGNLLKTEITKELDDQMITLFEK